MHACFWFKEPKFRECCRLPFWIPCHKQTIRIEVLVLAVLEHGVVVCILCNIYYSSYKLLCTILWHFELPTRWSSLYEIVVRGRSETTFANIPDFWHPPSPGLHIVYIGLTPPLLLRLHPSTSPLRFFWYMNQPEIKGDWKPFIRFLAYFLLYFDKWKYISINWSESEIH